MERVGVTETTAQSSMKELIEFYKHSRIDIDVIIFGKKHTIKNFPWVMP